MSDRFDLLLHNLADFQTICFVLSLALSSIGSTKILVEMDPETSDNQTFLSAAWHGKNIHRFRLALLLNGTNPELIDEYSKMNIFEKCCLTPGYSEFIRECIRWGCDVNRTNKYSNKRALNYAIQSGDPENIRAILEDPTRIAIENENYEHLPLHQLAQKINIENYDSMFGCMKELIDRRTNVNAIDKDNQSALLIIANQSSIPQEQKEIIIKYFLENSPVDLDSHRNGETRYIINAQFPNLRLPPEIKQTEKKTWDFIRLITALRDSEENEFLVGLDIFLTRVQHEIDVENLFRERFISETLLMVAAKNGLARAAEKLLRAGADVNNYATKFPTTMKQNDLDDSSKTKSPLELACMYGNWEVLDLFLKCPNIDLGDAPLLVEVVKNIGEPGRTRSCDYRKCFYLLLNFPTIDINQVDSLGYTALHAAVKYNNKAETLAILGKGAYIGCQNKLTELPITDIDPKILETHFNSCIATNGRRSGDDNYEIRFHYFNLVPVVVRNDKQNFVGSSLIQCTDEMAPIEHMAKSSELKHLVKHPLIASFLFLKWHQLALVFYTNFFCYTIYCLAMILYLLFCYGQNTCGKGMSTILFLISLLGVLYVIVREIAQLVMSPRVYVRNKENYLEIVLIFTTAIVLINIEFEDSTRRTVAAFTILLAVTEFFLLTGSLPVLSFSTHLVMLKTVSKNFVKGLLLYSIILIAFALCFYTLLGTYRTDPPDDVAEFNNFVHPGVAIIKAVVMLTGEFDASNVHFQQNTTSYVLFVIFVFLISTVLNNLLNGLAVSDTQSIKAEAELMNFIYRSELMARYEKILLGKGENVCCNFILRKMSSSLMNVFPEFLPLNMLTVLPNSNNKVLIPILPQVDVKRTAEVGYSSYRSLERGFRAMNCCFGMRCSRMEVKIVKYAKHVLDIKGRDYEEQQEKLAMTQRIIKIENRIDEMFTKLDTILESVKKEYDD